MSSTIVFFLFIPLLSLILLAINIVFAPHNPYVEKNNPFECGYTSFVGQNRIQFSISFFIFALLFLLFDLEILLVYPYLVSAYINETYGFLILMIFLVILTIGFVFELGKKALTIESRQTTRSNCNSIRKSLTHTNITINSNITNNLYVKSSVLTNKNQLDFSKLTVIHSSFFNVKILFTKSFWDTYFTGLKNKFDYKWVISMLLAIIIAFFFRNILRSYIISCGLDLDSIIVIAVSIPLGSVFFKLIFHLLELIISDVDNITKESKNNIDILHSLKLIFSSYDQKMTMGPNNDIEIPKNPRDSNIMLKKNQTETINQSNNNSDSYSNSNTNNTQDQVTINNMQNQATTNNMQNRTDNRKSFQSLPAEIQLTIANIATYNEQELKSKSKELSNHYKALDKAIDKSTRDHAEEWGIMLPHTYSKQGWTIQPWYQDDATYNWINNIRFARCIGGQANCVLVDHVLEYDKCIKTMKEMIISQSQRRVLLPYNFISVKNNETVKILQHLEIYESMLKQSKRISYGWDDKDYLFYQRSNSPAITELNEHEKKFPNIKNKNIE